MMNRTPRLSQRTLFVLIPCIILAICLAVSLRVHAIGGNPSDPSAPSFYAIWNDADKSISFSATEPAEGTYEEVKEVKPFIRSHKADVKTIDFAFKNAAGQSEKIALGPEEARELFLECINLVTIDNLGNLDTSKVTDMRRMFRNCESLTAIDASGFDTSHVTTMRGMFYQCYKLESINVGSFDTSQVTDLSLMFYMCKSLKSIDVSHFNTEKSRSFYFMFGYCKELTELDASSFTSPGIGSDPVSDYPGFTAFVYGCPKLKVLDISNLTSNYWGGCFQNGFTGSYQIERLSLGENTILEVAGRFAGCGLSGNWAKETDPDTMFTTGDLIDKYSSSGSPEKAVWIRYAPEGHYYRTDGTLNQDNMWEYHSPNERFKGYCLNKFRNGVSTALDRVQITSDAQLRQHLDSNHGEASIGYAPLGNSVEEALVTIMYYGWPNDKAGIQAKYGLTDDQYMEVTQNAIWDFVDRYDNKSGPENQTEAMIGAYNELLAQRYANIPEKYELYVYTSWDKNHQNLISIRSLTDGIYGGVEVFKQDPRLQPLSGAEFTVYTLDGEKVRTMVSGSDGYASICETDSYQGLPAGEYYVMETKAPAGYVKQNGRYYFTISESNKIVTLGRWGSGGSDEYMIFENTVDRDYKGGGISVKKVSEDDKPLIGAEFTIYQDGSEIMTIISNDEGIAATGKRDLPLGDYTIKETKPPAGYVAMTEEQRFTIASDNEFKELAFTFTNKGKEGEAVIDARKKFTNGKLAGGEFTFRLTTMDGEVLQEATNDAEGKVVFEPIRYTSADQGYANYKIVEVKGDDKGIVYDTHEELVTVTIIDTGKEKLECTAIYDEDGPLFDNTREPFIEKTINDTDTVVLDNTSKEVSYTITTLVPEDISNFKVLDDLPDVLAFGPKNEFVIKVDGEETDLPFTVKDNLFTLELKDGIVQDYAGCELEITFNARVKEGADLEPYKVGDTYVVNNIASCVINNDFTISSEPDEASLVLDEYSDTTTKKSGRKAAKGTGTGDTSDLFAYAALLLLSLLTFAFAKHKKSQGHP